MGARVWFTNEDLKMHGQYATTVSPCSYEGIALSRVFVSRKPPPLIAFASFLWVARTIFRAEDVPDHGRG